MEKGGGAEEQGALKQADTFHIPASHWWRLLLLVCLTVLIGMLYVCLRTNVHSRLVLRAERNRNFHLNSTDFKHLSQVPIGTFSAALDSPGSDSRAMYLRTSRGRPRVRRRARRPAGFQPWPELGNPAGENFTAAKRAALRICMATLHHKLALQKQRQNQAIVELWANVCVHFIIKNCVW